MGAGLPNEMLTEILRVEKLFVVKLKDDVVRELTKANTDTLDVVIAHQQLERRVVLVDAILRVRHILVKSSTASLHETAVTLTVHSAGILKVFGTKTANRPWSEYRTALLTT